MAHEATIDGSRALQALLDYYRACGVDCALGETARDRFADSARPAPKAPVEASAAPPQPRSGKPPAALFPEETTRIAESVAAAAQTLDELRESLASFEGFGSVANARHFLFSLGAPSAIMAMDYAPGETEERGGVAFSGAEARLLDAMFRAIGTTRKNLYYAYFSPWRPPGGQAFAPHVAAALAPFARRHIELARPKAVLLFGDAARHVLGSGETLTRLYARPFELRLGGQTIVAVPAPGLAAMLRTSALKPRAWSAVRIIGALLAES
jgi:uracil-DNA glycosylase family 4